MTIPDMGDHLVKRNKKPPWKMRIFYVLIEMSIVQVSLFSKTSHYALRIAHFTKYIFVLKTTPNFYCLNGKMHILKI